MMLKTTLLNLFLSFNIGCQHVNEWQCYRCAFDMTEQKLCVQNGRFTFSEIEFTTEVAKLEGTYQMAGDTLILNKGVNVEGNHEFANEISLFIKDNKIYYLINDSTLSPLYFTKVGAGN